MSRVLAKKVILPKNKKYVPKFLKQWNIGNYVFLKPWTLNFIVF